MDYLPFYCVELCWYLIASQAFRDIDEMTRGRNTSVTAEVSGGLCIQSNACSPVSAQTVRLQRSVCEMPMARVLGKYALRQGTPRTTYGCCSETIHSC